MTRTPDSAPGSAEAVQPLRPAGAATSSRDQAADPLAAVIAAVARHYGIETTAAVIMAGLPIAGPNLPRSQAANAAAHAGLDAQFCDIDLRRIEAHELPIVLHVAGGSYEVLWSLSSRNGASVALVSTASQPDRRVEVPLDDALEAATGQALRLRPLTNPDRRADEAAPAKNRNWFLAAFSDCRPIYAHAIAATLAINVLALAVPLFSMNIYDRVIPNAAEATLWALAIGVAIATGFDFVLRTLRAVFVDAAGRRADVRLSQQIFSRLIGAKGAKQPGSVGIRSNTVREFDALREFFNSATVTAFGDLPFAVLFLAIIYFVAGSLALVVLAAVPVILIAGYLTQRALDRLTANAFRETAQKNAVVVETLFGLDSIRASGAESWAAQKWERAVAEHIRTGLAIRHTSNIGLHFIHACQTSVQVAIVVVGFYQVAAGEITMGALIAATILSGRVVAPLAQAAGLLARLNQARMAYRSLTAIMTQEQEREPGRTYLTRPELTGAIAFEEVGFRYADDAPATLGKVSFEIASGERVAILGAIGSGKSTILKLAQGHLVADAGRVLFDGLPIGQIDPFVLRRDVGLLLQGADLFHGTIRENIAMGRPLASDADILVAARVAGALDWIVRLPHGFDTRIHERGAGLSGGQRQSVALARALIGRPRALLLDEPTSDMDTRTEAAVVRRLADHLDGRTLVLVTHRPALLSLVDRIIVIDQGCKRLDGPRDSVLAELKSQLEKTVRAEPRTSSGAA